MKKDTISASEQIVRLLHRDWIVEGVLQATAFTLQNGETYLSVNRPAVDSFQMDVYDFLKKHPSYKITDDGNLYQRAEMVVGAVCNICPRFEKQLATLTVEVEPRDVHVLSHAGIFIRVEGKNLRGGQQTMFKVDEEKTVSSDAILQKVRLQLLHLSELKQVCLPFPDKE